MSFMKALQRKLRKLEHFVLHKTVFHNKTGEIDFYGLQDDELPKEVDGQVVVWDTRANPAVRVAYWFRFENRYMTYRPVGNRVAAVFQVLHRMDGVRPMGLIENGRFYTQFGHYDGVPKVVREVLQLA